MDTPDLNPQIMFTLTDEPPSLLDGIYDFECETLNFADTNTDSSQAPNENTMKTYNESDHGFSTLHLPTESNPQMTVAPTYEVPYPIDWISCDDFEFEPPNTAETNTDTLEETMTLQAHSKTSEAALDTLDSGDVMANRPIETENTNDNTNILESNTCTSPEQPEHHLSLIHI